MKTVVPIVIDDGLFVQVMAQVKVGLLSPAAGATVLITEAVLRAVSDQRAIDEAEEER